MTRVHEAVAKAIAQTGTRTVFGLMGDANMLILTSMMIREQLRFVPATYEGAAVAMADGHARATQQLTVVSVTHGPALTNTITALVEARKSRSRVLLLTGDPPSVRDHLQYIDIAMLVAPTGAGYERVFSAETTVDDVKRAVWRVNSEHRPIVLNVPFDLLQQEVGEIKSLRSSRDVAPLTAVSAEPLDEALGLLASARHPLILAGRGVVESAGRDALVELADVVDAPLSTTLGAKDLFRGHARNIGLCGTIATSVGLEIITQSDCIVAFGASMNQYTTDRGSLLRGKRVIQVDLDASQIARRDDVDISILGDARHVAETMAASLRTAGLADGSRLEGSGVKWAAAAQPQPFQDRSTVDSIDLRAAMTMLDDVLPADRGLVTDVGRFMLAAWKYLPLEDPKRFVPVVNFGSIGLGLGSAIGASVADPDHVTVLVAGDGGMMMNIGELATAVRERLPLVVVVANDGAYGAEYRKLKEYGVDPAYSLNQWPDFAAMARGFGCDAVTVRTATDIKLVKERVSELNGPLVVDLKIDPAVDISQ